MLTLLATQPNNTSIIRKAARNAMSPLELDCQDIFGVRCVSTAPTLCLMHCCLAQLVSTFVSGHVFLTGTAQVGACTGATPEASRDTSTSHAGKGRC